MNLGWPWRLSVLVTFAACSRGGDAGPVDAHLDVTPNDATVDSTDAIDAPAETGGAGSSVLERNNGPSRDGMFVQPTLTHAAASRMARDTHFDGTISGAVLASPLYFQPGPGEHGLVIVATESNDVSALDEFSGSVVWKRHLGPPASSTGVGCGNVLPLGVTGTPYIDAVGRTLYVDAAIGDGTAANAILTHEIHALSIVDGSERAGWPADTRGLMAAGIPFVPQAQNQRGSLTGMGGVLYVPYGGHAGDCGNYHGWVVAVPFADPKHPSGFVTSASGAGIWGPGGLANDGTAVFAATGNALGATTWSGGEAVLRLQPSGQWSGSTADYFTPSNWKYLDAQDLDLGASGPVLLDVPGATPSALVVAVAKAGVMYLLDRSNLGGIGHGDGGAGEGVTSSPVDSFVISVSAAYSPLRKMESLSCV
jgi:hypothetical protein